MHERSPLLIAAISEHVRLAALPVPKLNQPGNRENLHLYLSTT
jgi:hypothetical protein